MKNKRMLIIFLITIIIVGLVSYSSGKVSGARNLFRKPKVSPSGTYELVEVHGLDFNNFRHVEFIILPAATKDNSEQRQGYLIEGHNLFYTRFNLYGGWGENDTLWVYSGDIGIFCWTLVDGNWIKISVDEKSVLLAPEEIRKYWEKHYEKE